MICPVSGRAGSLLSHSMSPETQPTRSLAISKLTNAMAVWFVLDWRTFFRPPAIVYRPSSMVNRPSSFVILPHP
jgi:hypothetical protein